MNKPKFFVLAVLLLCASTAVLAQTEDNNKIESSYEIVLHVIVASNDKAENGKLPPSLSAVAGKLKNDFSYNKYALAATFLERMSATGVIGHTGILNQLKQTENEKVYFSEWGLSGLKSGRNEQGKDLIQFQTFNFGAKVPVVTAIGAKGDGEPIVSYENIGLRITRFNLPENTPTIIGSLATPKTDEFIFLVLTVRAV